MKAVLMGIGSALVFGTFLLIYIKKVKAKLKKYVLRHMSEGKD